MPRGGAALPGVHRIAACNAGGRLGMISSMSDSGRPIDPAALLAETDWLRALAGALVRDPGAADDAAQEAAIAALEHPPQGERRAWLFRVLTNFVRQRQRGERRRDRRERAASRHEAATAADLVERVETHRLLAELVASLPEPNRTAVILRFYEDLEPAEIARRLGVPPGTARARVHRGLAQLRERLDARHGGDRERWLALAAPLAIDGSAPRGAPLRPGLVAAFAAAVLVAGGVALTWTFLASRERAPEVATTAAAAPSGAPARRARAAIDGERDGPSPSPVPATHIEGEVLDLSGAPVAGASVAFVARAHPDAAGAASRTGADGRFALDVRDDPGPSQPRTLLVRATGFAPVFASYFGCGQFVRVLLSRGAFVEGRVVDATGAPVEGASVRAVPMEAESMDASPAEVVAGTDASGWFRAGPVGASSRPRLDLVARGLDGWPGTLRDVAPPTGGPVVVELCAKALLRGRVVTADGAPLPGLGMRLRSHLRMAGEWPSAGRSLRVAMETPLVLRSDGSFEAAVPSACEFVGLAVDDTAWEVAPASRFVKRSGDAPVELAIRAKSADAGPVAESRHLPVTGRIEDEEGRPIAAALVVVETESSSPCVPVRTDEHGVWRSEAVAPGPAHVAVEAAGFGLARATVEVGASGVEVPAIRLRHAVRLRGRVVDDEGAPVVGAVVACEAAGETDEQGAVAFQVRTGRDGRFETPAGAGAATVAVALAPGFECDGASRPADVSGAEILFTLRRARRIEGRLSHPDDSPIAERSVRAFRSGSPAACATTRTDADGGFVLDGLPGGTYRLDAGDGDVLDEVPAGAMDVRWRLAVRGGDDRAR